MEGDDEEEEEGSLTEKSHDEAPESPSPVTTGVYEEDEEEEETETAPLAMSYEHTRRYSFYELCRKLHKLWFMDFFLLESIPQIKCVRYIVSINRNRLLCLLSL